MEKLKKIQEGIVVNTDFRAWRTARKIRERREMESKRLRAVEDKLIQMETRVEDIYNMLKILTEQNLNE